MIRSVIYLPDCNWQTATENEMHGTMEATFIWFTAPKSWQKLLFIRETRVTVGLRRGKPTMIQTITGSKKVLSTSIVALLKYKPSISITALEVSRKMLCFNLGQYNNAKFFYKIHNMKTRDSTFWQNINLYKINWVAFSQRKI